MSEINQPTNTLAIDDELAIHRYALNNSGDLIWFWDITSDDLITYGNNLTLLGFDNKKLTSTMQSWVNDIHPEDVKKTRLAVIELLKEGAHKIDQAYRLKNGNSDWVWLHTKGTVYARDQNGRATTMGGYTHLINEQKELEAKYETAHHLFHHAFENTYDTLWDWDIASGVVNVSLSWKVALGLPLERELLVCKDWDPLIHPDDLENAYDHVRELIKGTTKNITVDYRIKLKDGSYHWMTARGHIAERTPDGQAKRMIGILTNIHDLKEQEDILVEQDKQLALVMYNTGSSVFDYDISENTIIQTSFSSENGKIIIHKRSTSPQETLTVHPLDLHLRKAFFEQFSGNKKITTAETKWRSNSQIEDYRWYHIKCSVVERDTQGYPTRVVGIRQDIDENYRLELAIKEERDRELNALKDTLHGIWEWDLITDKLYVSRNIIAQLTTHPDTWNSTYAGWLKFIFPEDLPVIDTEILQQAKGDSNEFRSEYRIKLIDGSIAWVQIKGNIVEWDEDHQPLRAVGSIIDISDQKEVEFALAQEKEIAQTTLNAINDAVITTDINSKIISLNPTARTLLYAKEKEVLGENLTSVCDLFEEDMETPAQDPAALAIHSDLAFNLNTLILKNTHGQQYYIDCSVAPIHNEDSKAIGSVMIIRDVTHARKLSREIEYRAMHDSLTGLYNRQEFESKLYSSTEVEDAEHALCYLDLDQFKIVNDTCGHIAGDELLRQLSKILASSIRKSDVLARLGGDEFGILMQNCDLDKATLKSEEILHTLADYTFHWEENSFKIGASIGIASINSICSASQSLQNADAACFVAKETGRNRVHVYHSDDDELISMHGEMGWVPRIQRALEKDLFELHVQAIVDLKDDQQRPHHYEVLIRLNEEEMSIPPGAFLPAAERYNLSTQIDKWVIDKTFSTINTYTGHIESEDVFNINLSAPSLIENGFVAFIQDKFKQYHINPSNICFEITETSAIANLSSAQGFIKTLQEMGCEFALDDFGSGLSSFGYLKNFPVDYLKIDGFFIKDILDDPIDAAMVRSINEIGQIMGKKTVAEWVENEDIANILKQIGVDFAQGYHYSKPQPFTKTLSELPLTKKQLN